MLRVRTLGFCEISFLEHHIGPESTAIFTVLLLAALRAPRPLLRVELAGLLWPDVPQPLRNHRLRSLLHRIRRMGVTLESNEIVVRIAGAPTIDFREFVRPPRSLEDVERRVPGIGVVLPGLRGAAGSPLASRFDDERDIIIGTVIRWVSVALSIAKTAGAWSLVEQLARAGREVDSFNEEAWLSLAEAQCLTASKERALRTIDDYIASVGDRDASIALPAQLLRCRVAEHVSTAAIDESNASRDGSGEMLATLWSAVARAARGHGGGVLLWKCEDTTRTRLIQAIERVQLASPTRVLVCTAQPLHSQLPIELVLDVAAHLLEQPGAAGCDPAAYRVWRDLRPKARNDTAAIPSSVELEGLLEPFTELLAAVSDETALVCLLDNAQFVAAEDWTFWSKVVEWSADRALLWIFLCSTPAVAQPTDSPPIRTAMMAF